MFFLISVKYVKLFFIIVIFLVNIVKFRVWNIELLWKGKSGCIILIVFWILLEWGFCVGVYFFLIRYSLGSYEYFYDEILL